MTVETVNNATHVVLNHFVSKVMARSLGIANWTSNMTYDAPQSLLDQIEEYREPPSVLLSEEHAWYRPYPATLFLILLLHVVFFLQWNQRRTKKQVWASYQQLIVRKQWYRAWCAMLSHPPGIDSSTQRDGSSASSSSSSNLSIDFGTAAAPSVEGDTPWVRTSLIAFHHLQNGPVSGLPLLVYNCHLLWTFRALEALLSSSWHYLRSLLALTTLSLALELTARYWLVQRTSHVAGRTNNSYGSIQPEFGSDPIVKLRKLALYEPMGTCTSLVFAVLFMYHLVFPYVQLQALPVLPLGFLPPWLSYLLCGALLTVISRWRMACFFAGTMAACLWILGFHFLGKLYWSCWLIAWIGMATLLSLKHRYPNWVLAVDYVSWNAVGVVLDRDGVPVMTSLAGTPASNEDGDDGDESFHDDDHNSINDPENPIHGRLPTMDALDEDGDEPMRSHSAHSGQLTRRIGGTVS
jgi:hypothetical protein